MCDLCFFFNDTATTEIYTLSLHDALPISLCVVSVRRATILILSAKAVCVADGEGILHSARSSLPTPSVVRLDRKSTRLNSSHANISYAVFCLKKKSSTFSLSYSCRTFFFS